MFKSIGGLINNLTGATSSANNSYHYNLALQGANYQNQKEVMQNSHQWEMQDLMKAGLNPALTAGGSGASAGGAGGGGGGVSGQVGNLSTILSTIGMFNEMKNKDKLTTAQSSNLNADTMLKLLEHENFPKEAKAKIANLWVDTALKQEQIRNTATDSDLKSQLRATSASQAKLQGIQGKVYNKQIEDYDSQINKRKEENYLTWAQTKKTTAEKEKILYGKIAEVLGTQKAGQIMYLIDQLQKKGQKHNLWKMIEEWIK